MKKNLLAIFVLALIVYMVGCGKKEAAMEEAQAPMSMDALSKVAAEPKAVAPQAQMQVTPAAVEPQGVLESLPPSGPYKPKAEEVQAALKNAGFYAGTVDGKIGPKTKNAIMEFQKAKGLEADGKVGPKTWSVLSLYLNQPASGEAQAN